MAAGTLATAEEDSPLAKLQKAKTRPPGLLPPLSVVSEGWAS